MNIHSFLRRFIRLRLLLCVLLVSACGNYNMKTPITSHQEVAKMSGYPALSGRPSLRAPSRIGVFTTGRTDSLNFSAATQGIEPGGNIESIQQIDPFITQRHYRDLNAVISKRAKLLHEARFLGLDVIVVCDQETKRDRSPSLVRLATLGILDAGLRKQDTQITVVCIDARTGYVYGVMGRQQHGRAPRLALFHVHALGDTDRNHIARATRREAVEQFPEFWDGVVKDYAGRR